MGLTVHLVENCDLLIINQEAWDTLTCGELLYEEEVIVTQKNIRDFFNVLFLSNYCVNSVVYLSTCVC